MVQIVARSGGRETDNPLGFSPWGSMAPRPYLLSEPEQSLGPLAVAGKAEPVSQGRVQGAV